MSYNFLVLALVVISIFLALVVPFIVIKAYERGLNAVKTGNHGEVKLIEGPKKSKKAKEQSAEQMRVEKILRNIDNYHGSDIGQEKF